MPAVALDEGTPQTLTRVVSALRARDIPFALIKRTFARYVLPVTVAHAG